MNVTSCEKKENIKAELTVVVTPEEFDKALDESYRKNRSQIAVPGFRKGKAPRKLIENMYGKSVFYDDALEVILPAVCEHGVSESDLRTVGYPQILDVDFGDDKTVTVKYSVELYPEVTIGEYKGLKAVKPEPVIEDAAVDSEIASVQLRNARIQTAERPAMNGDTVIIDFEGFVDGVAFEGGKGENYELELGSNSFIPGFEEKLNGMQVGEERDLDLVFPEQYKEDLAGKPVLFKVKLSEVKEKILPELDDEFAKDVSEYDTMEEYKNSIRENLTTAKEAESQKAFEDGVMTALAATIDQEVPEAMVKDVIDNQMQNMAQQLASYGMQLEQYMSMMGMNEDAFRENMKPSAQQQVKISLALEKIAELEKFEPSEEDVEKYYTEMAERYGVEADMVKQSVPKESVARDLGIQEASKLVIENAVAEAPPKEEEGAKEEKKAPAKKPAAKKTKADTDEAAPAAEKPATKKTTAKKPAAKKETTGEAAAKKTTTKKPAAKKETAAKTTASKTAAKKETTGETAEKKPTTKKAAPKKPAAEKKTNDE